MSNYKSLIVPLALSIVLMAIVLGCVPAGVSIASADPRPREVLLLHSFERDWAPFDTIAREFRTSLSTSVRLSG